MSWVIAVFMAGTLVALTAILFALWGVLAELRIANGKKK